MLARESSKAATRPERPVPTMMTGFSFVGRVGKGVGPGEDGVGEAMVIDIDAMVVGGELLTVSLV